MWDQVYRARVLKQTTWVWKITSSYKSPNKYSSIEFELDQLQNIWIRAET